MKLQTVLASVLALALYASTISSQPVNSKVFSEFSSIEYDHSGLLALFGSPSSAKAFNGKRLVAEAVVEFDGNLEPGSLKTIRVKETHYDIDGNVVYEGVIIFETSFGGYKVSDEEAVKGKRPLQVFTSWPINR